MSREFNKREALYFALVLSVSVISLFISVSTLFVYEHRYINLMKKIDVINNEKLSQHRDYYDDLAGNVGHTSFGKLNSRDSLGYYYIIISCQ